MRVIIAFLLVLAFAAGAAADKSVTYFTATTADVTSVCFSRQNETNGWRATASAWIRSSTGGYASQLSGGVTVAQKTAIENYISTHVLPAINGQEGL